MQDENGRVTFLPNQIRRLADLFEFSSCAVEVKQYGSVLEFFDGTIKLRVNADGDVIHPSNQEHLW